MDTPRPMVSDKTEHLVPDEKDLVNFTLLLYPIALSQLKAVN